MKKLPPGLALLFAAAMFFIAVPALIFKMYFFLGLAVLPIAGAVFMSRNYSLKTEGGRSPSSASSKLANFMTTRPTIKAAVFFALSVPLGLLAVVGAPSAWYVALYLPVGLLTFIGLDLMAALPNRRLAAEVSLPSRLAVGQIGAVGLELRAEGQIRPTRFEALLELKGETAPPEIVAGLLGPEGLKLELPIRPDRRGRVTVEALWLRWRGPLGLIEKKRRLEEGGRIDVIPDVRGIHQAALQFFARDAVYGVKTQNFKGEGTEFENLCDYAQGMDSRFIDWKHSARHRKLLCKEFRQERNHQVVLGFDTGHLMLEPIDGLPKLDHAIKAGLLLSWLSLYHGDLVGGCGFDGRFRSYLRPGRGLSHFSQFQRFTAGLDYHTEETNFTLGLAELNARLSRRALVVLFTEFVDVISAELLLESLQLMTRRHVVIFVTAKDPMLTGLQNAAPLDFTRAAEAVIAGDFLRERAIVLERVARMGIHCLNVPADGISAALLNRYLLIKQRGLL